MPCKHKTAQFITSFTLQQCKIVKVIVKVDSLMLSFAYVKHSIKNIWKKLQWKECVASPYLNPQIRNDTKFSVIF